MSELSQRVGEIRSSATLALSALARQLRQQGAAIIAFGAGEPDLPIPESVCEQAIAAIRAGHGKYTAAAGLPELREAIALRFTEDGYPMTPEQCICTAGAKSGLYLALFALLDPGDEVIFPVPSWNSYTDLVVAAGGRPVPVPTTVADDFQPAPEHMAAAITRRTKVLLLNSPNNPTGSVLSRESLESLAELVQRHRLTVISDDIYATLLYTDEPFLNLRDVAPDLADRIVLVNGLSKSHSMTGWRMGYAGGPLDVIQAMIRVQSQTIGNPNSITQFASLEALAHPPLPSRKASLDTRRKLMLQELRAVPGFSCPEPRGAFYAFPSIRDLLGRTYRGEPVPDDEAFCRLLLKEKLVACVPGHVFGGPGHIRLTYTVPEAEIREGVARIREFAAELS